MERELRRYEKSLIITGLGTMVLTVWSILKTVLFIELDADRFDAFIAEMVGAEYNRSIIMFVMFFFMTFDLIFRLIVGLKARREGHGRRCGYFYLVLDAIFILGNLISISAYFTSGSYGTGLSSTLVFELTSLYTGIDLMYSDINVKILRKKLGEEAKTCAA